LVSTIQQHKEDLMSNAPAYAIAYLREIQFGDDIIEYLQKIDATLAPYGGRFIVHGGEVHGKEGEWDGSIVIIEFPSVEAAQEWYAAPAYQEILPLRTNNTQSIAALVEGVPAGYQATDGLAAMLAARVS